GDHTAGRLYSEQLLEPLNIPLCRDWQQVEAALDAHNLAFAPLGDWMPVLQQMIDLRNILGLRSPIHSLARLINPLGARCGLQSIFHPGYQESHREASRLLGDCALVIKGEGGEIEVNPDSPCQLFGTTDGLAWDEQWPAMASQRHVKPAHLEVSQLVSFWRGEQHNDYGEQAVLGSMALALRGLGMQREAALQRAAELWQQRPRQLTPQGAPPVPCGAPRRLNNPALPGFQRSAPSNRASLSRRLTTSPTITRVGAFTG